MLRIIATAAALAAVSACATQPVASASAPVLAPSEVVETAWSAPKADAGILLVSRDKGLLGSGCAVGVFVNNTPVGALKSGEQIRLYPPLGETLVSARFGGGICGKEAKQVNLTLKPGVESKARIGYQYGGLFIEQSGF